VCLAHVAVGRDQCVVQTAYWALSSLRGKETGVLDNG